MICKQVDYYDFDQKENVVPGSSDASKICRYYYYPTPSCMFLATLSCTFSCPILLSRV